MANLTDNKLMIFLLFSTENKIWHFVQIVSSGDNLHEVSKPVILEECFNMSSAENFTQSVKC